VTWTIKYTEIAAKQIKKLDKTIAKKILQYLSVRVAKQKDPTLLGKPLLHNKSGLWRYRIDDYRIICKIENKQLTVLVLRIGHRKEIYRD
jgi:mRNA interferase RelE/StbE